MIVPIDGATFFLNDQKHLSFCSHDYLGLSDHSEVKKNAIKFLLQYGMCATTSENPSYAFNHQKQLEDKLAVLLGKEIVLFFSSPPPISSMGKNVIFAESIHSIGGHFTDLSQISIPKDSLLCVDDSHSFALFGKEGMGLSAHQNGIDLITGSLSKGCGVFGYYLACSLQTADLIQKIPDPFPSAVIGALEAALELIPNMEGERKQLEQRSHFLRSALEEIGLKPISSISPLVALPFDSQEEAEALRKSLSEAHICVAPSKKLHGQFLLQFALTSAHMPDHLALLMSEIKAWKEALVAN